MLVKRRKELKLEGRTAFFFTAQPHHMRLWKPIFDRLVSEGLKIKVFTAHTPYPFEYSVIPYNLEPIFIEEYLDSEIIEKIAINPRKILDVITGGIEEGNCADITLFNPTLEWEFTTKDIQSKSVNTPFVGKQLKGKALAIYNKGQFQEC